MGCLVTVAIHVSLERRDAGEALEKAEETDVVTEHPLAEVAKSAVLEESDKFVSVTYVMINKKEGDTALMPAQLSVSRNVTDKEDLAAAGNVNQSDEDNNLRLKIVCGSHDGGEWVEERCRKIMSAQLLSTRPRI